MKKTLLLVFALFGLFFLWPKESWAATCDSFVSGLQIQPGGSATIHWDIFSLNPGETYTLYSSACAPRSLCRYSKNADSSGRITGDFVIAYSQTSSNITLSLDSARAVVNPYCTYTILANVWNRPPTPTPRVGAGCYLSLEPPRITDRTRDVYLNGSIINLTGMTGYNISCQMAQAQMCSARVDGLDPPKTYPASAFSIDNTSSPRKFRLNLGRNWPDGDYTANVSVGVSSTSFPRKYAIASCNRSFNVPDGVIYTAPPPAGPEPYPSLAPLCEQIPGQFLKVCKDCIGQGKIWTAIGCLSPDFGSFVSQQLLGFGVGIAGGIAFLYFLYGAFLFLTSQGNPEQIAHAREIIMSALLGLLLIIFSVFLLRVISVDILKLPGFSIL